MQCGARDKAHWEALYSFQAKRVVHATMVCVPDSDHRVACDAPFQDRQFLSLKSRCIRIFGF